MSEREGSQRERGARRAGRPALAPAGLSEERTQSGGPAPEDYLSRVSSTVTPSDWATGPE